MSITLSLLSVSADGLSAAVDAAAPVTEAIHGSGHGQAAGDPAVHHEAFLGLDAKGWVAVSTLLFVGILLYLKVPAAIVKALDDRIAGIRNQLSQAAALRAEAEALKAEYEAKLAEAERTAAEIAAQAKAEAEDMIAEARQQVEALTNRRREAAENKIAVAERAAVAEIREAAVRIGATAASRLIAEKLSDDRRGQLVDSAITELDGRLH